MKRNRRHGHPQQIGITKAYIKPHMKRIERWLQGQPSDPWPKLEKALEVTVEKAKGEIRAAQSGAVFVRHELAAAGDVVAVAGQADTRELLLTVFAMVLLRYEEEGIFRSDKAFLHELARRWRGCGETHVAVYWNHNQNRSLRVFRDASPKRLEALGLRLATTLGPFAGEIMRTWKAEARSEEVARREALDAVAGRSSTTATAPTEATAE